MKENMTLQTQPVEKRQSPARALKAALRKRLTAADSLASLEVRESPDSRMLEVLLHGRLLLFSLAALLELTESRGGWDEGAACVLARARRKSCSPPRTWDLTEVEEEVTRHLERIAERLPDEEKAELAQRLEAEIPRLGHDWARSRRRLDLLEEAIMAHLARENGKKANRG